MKRLEYEKTDTLYACPKSYSVAKNSGGRYITPRGYSMPSNISIDDITYGWLPYNSKATNKYSNITNIVYMVNIFPNVDVFRYVNNRLKECVGRELLHVDEYALTVLLQCLWRCRIRQNRPIHILFLSERMENIFRDWVNSL